ncbi:haloacid dehalogenase [Frankia sp. AgB1.9]|uniref:haloacid dehalogenase n=2 Tax=Frankia TaxID=1854 RepID=UPI0019337D92|nr:haloacid dehalogenase [Frankia sp. AgB1.9]MBL7549142.1 haloacid dehalogenase [Frankia sp. AgB1.9]MBL7619174.1 haloacid dehalogenase [Frankia sp. AgB1.8]
MFDDARLGHAWSHLDSGGADALSVDVFETLLWRLVPEPAHAFLLLGERLAAAGRLPPDVTAGQFAHLRVLAEAQARQQVLANRGGAGRVGAIGSGGGTGSQGSGSQSAGHPRLDEIWALLRPALPGAGELDYLLDAELSVLRAIYRVDLDAAELVELAALKLGLPVYLVADTCLSGAQLDRLLARAELAGIPFAGLFTSADVGVGPADGLLDHVAAATGTPAARLLHLAGDPTGAAEAGATRPATSAPNVTVIRRGEATAELRATLAAEGLLGDPDDATPVDPEYGDFGLTALRARVLHRTEATGVPRALRRFWDTGATVFGPVFTGFAEWVVERTQELGAQEAFCLMRSGEFVAGLLAGPGRDAGVTARPLWASREVCALANVFEASAPELRAFLAHAGTGPPPGESGTSTGAGGAVGTVGALLRRLRVDLATVPGISALAGRRLDVPAGLLDEILEELLETLSHDDRIRGEIVLAAERLRERFLRYLDERLPDRGPAVLVDLGWDGTTQVLLARLLAATGRDVTPVGLYLATGPAVHAHRLAGHRMEGYLVSAGQPARLAGQLLRAPAVVEQVAMADAGALISFDEGSTPLLGLGRASRTQLAQRGAVQDGARAFQREWLRYREAQTPDDGDSALPSLCGDGARLALLRTLTRFVARPTAAEAAAFGAWRHDGDGQGLVPAELIRRMPYLSPAGLAELPPREATWPAAVAAVANRPLALVTELAVAAGIDPRELSASAAAGPVEVYVDTGADFARGPKATVTPYAGRDGLSLVRLRVDAVGARRVRIDPAGRRGLLRLDWLTLGFHIVGAGEPRQFTITAFEGPGSLETGESDRNGGSIAGSAAGSAGLAGRGRGVVLGLVGLRILQPNLVEVLDADPQLVYNLDLPGMPELGGTYAIDVEFAFGWMGIRGDPVAAPVPAAAGPAAGPQLPRRAARRVMRQLGGLR